jgi:hypothetical protein
MVDDDEEDEETVPGGSREGTEGKSGNIPAKSAPPESEAEEVMWLGIWCE